MLTSMPDCSHNHVKLPLLRRPPHLLKYLHDGLPMRHDRVLAELHTTVRTAFDMSGRVIVHAYMSIPNASP